MAKIRVIIADDHTIVRAGIKALLEKQPDIEIVGETSEGRETLRQVELLKPDMVLMDIAMPGMNGLEATALISRDFPQVRVLALTMHDEEEYFYEVIRAGAMGYVLKDAAPTELVSAIRAVAEGKAFLTPRVTRILVNDYLKRIESGEKVAVYDGLTEREREVLKLIASGNTNQEIANLLHLSVNTVQVHRTHIMEKLNLHNRTELVKYALRRGIIDLE